MLLRLERFLTRAKPEGKSHLLLPVEKQIKAWDRANRKMSWGIKLGEFDQLEAPPPLTDNDLNQGYIGVALFYGFGDDGRGNADSVLSGKLAWEYAVKRKKGKTWHCEYVLFDKPDYFRLRPPAPPRPKGFYYAKFQPGERFRLLTVSQVRKGLRSETGCGPEGIQFLAITNTHFQDMMNERKIPFMALADYDVAPYGFNDFFDAPQLFVTDHIFGLGIGNVDQNYPFFGVPTLRFPQKVKSSPALKSGSSLAYFGKTN